MERLTDFQERENFSLAMFTALRQLLELKMAVFVQPSEEETTSGRLPYPEASRVVSQVLRRESQTPVRLLEIEGQIADKSRETQKMVKQVNLLLFCEESAVVQAAPFSEFLSKEIASLQIDSASLKSYLKLSPETKLEVRVLNLFISDQGASLEKEREEAGLISLDLFRLQDRLKDQIVDFLSSGLVTLPVLVGATRLLVENNDLTSVLSPLVVVDLAQGKVQLEKGEEDG